MRKAMSESNKGAREAIEQLWATVFGEAPTMRCDPQVLTEALIRNLPPVPPYGDPPSLRDREPLPPIHHPDMS